MNIRETKECIAVMQHFVDGGGVTDEFSQLIQSPDWKELGRTGWKGLRVMTDTATDLLALRKILCHGPSGQSSGIQDRKAMISKVLTNAAKEVVRLEAEVKQLQKSVEALESNLEEARDAAIYHYNDLRNKQYHIYDWMEVDVSKYP